VAIGTLFSVCAGILIGMKLYFRLASRPEDRRFLKELWYGSGWNDGQDRRKK
jgi:hypothetical protein